MPYVKNPKGAIVEVTDEAAEYLLSDHPTATMAGKPLRDKDGNPVQIKKSDHEKGFSEPTQAEVDAFLEKQELWRKNPSEMLAEAGRKGKAASPAKKGSDNSGNSGAGNDAPWYGPISGVGKKTAEKLEAKGIKSAEDLKTALGATNEEATPGVVEILGGGPNADSVRAQLVKPE